MKQYVYYRKGTNHDGADDVAIVCAETMEEAKLIFIRYYDEVGDKYVREVDFNRKGYVKDIFIVSDY